MTDLPLIRIIDADNDALEAAYATSGLELRKILLGDPEPSPEEGLEAVKAFHLVALCWFNALDAGLVHLFASRTGPLHPMVREDRLDNCITWLGFVVEHFGKIYEIADEIPGDWDPQLPGFGSYATLQRYLTIHRPEYAASLRESFRAQGLPCLGFAALDKDRSLSARLSASPSPSPYDLGASHRAAKKNKGGES